MWDVSKILNLKLFLNSKCVSNMMHGCQENTSHDTQNRKRVKQYSNIYHYINGKNALISFSLFDSSFLLFLPVFNRNKREKSQWALSHEDYQLDLAFSKKFQEYFEDSSLLSF